MERMATVGLPPIARMKESNGWMDILARNILILGIILATLSPSRAVRIGKREISGRLVVREQEKIVLDRILERYDKRIRPPGANDTGPTIININLMIRNIEAISDIKREYSMQIILRQQWIDRRLMYDDLEGRIHYLTLTNTEMLWKPDLFFKNEKDGKFHKLILPNLYIRIFPDGVVLYSMRISLTLSCPMDLQLFPLDSQQCELIMASYGWTTSDLVFLWKSEDPVQITKNLHLPRFKLNMLKTDYCNSKTNTGEYSCIYLKLGFIREFAFYMIQYYLPCCILVVVSWLSFWLDQNAVLARVFLSVTTLLTMATQVSNINVTLPAASYTKVVKFACCLTAYCCFTSPCKYRACMRGQ